MDGEAPKAVMRVFSGNMKLKGESINKLFFKQLDNIYCIKKHLLTILPTLAEQASFPDLQKAIIENIDLIKLQVLRMDVIYKTCHKKYTDKNCTGAKTLSLEAYVATKAQNQLPVERDLSLLIHLQIIESVEIAYFSVLKNLSVALNNTEIEVLLSQNFETSTNTKKLYELIAREYIVT